MRKQRGRHVAKAACRHRRTTRSPIAGLERVVCHSCGNVSLRYLHAVIEDDIVLPETDPPTPTLPQKLVEGFGTLPSTQHTEPCRSPVYLCP